MTFWINLHWSKLLIKSTQFNASLYAPCIVHERQRVSSLEQWGHWFVQNWIGSSRRYSDTPEYVWPTFILLYSRYLSFVIGIKKCCKTLNTQCKHLIWGLMRFLRNILKGSHLKNFEITQESFINLFCEFFWDSLRIFQIFSEIFNTSDRWIDSCDSLRRLYISLRIFDIFSENLKT